MNLNYVTIHDAISTTVPESIAAADSGADPSWTITNSIFSGAADTFDLLNSTGTGNVSIANSAVVTAGAHAVAAEGDLGTGQLGDDPAYTSITYTVGRGEENPDFLDPTTASFNTASDVGAKIGATAPVPPAAKGWMSFE
jgi:hypothetical protein